LNEFLTTISLILGIICSCITIYQAFVKKTPTSSSPSQPNFPQQYPQYLYQQDPIPQVYYPTQAQQRRFSWSGCATVFLLALLSLLLLIPIPIFLSMEGTWYFYGIPKITLIMIILGVLFISVVLGIVNGFLKERR